ncbi:MAG: hypothetical protein OXU26_14225 [Acidobacteriota bacterium]|nr:hypothetical protein [Acidobacteriota bacterium]MDE2965061.1 hypothetical protein [Acidobacteriota bacterium]
MTSNREPVAPPSATSDETLDESLRALRRSRAQAAATAMQKASVGAGSDRLSLTEITAEIEAARRQR